MDEDTQKLIERARQRREMLTQRAANLPEAAPRKRRTPVLESDGSERDVLSEKQINQDDSPKRQCLREEELKLKPDTPAIRSVQSRAKDLVTGQENEAEDRSSPVASPRKNASSPPLGRRNLQTSPAKTVGSSINAPTSARKSRFAALAQNINNWEDDLTHHVVAKEEEKTTKRYFESPTKTAAIPSPKKTPAPPAPGSPMKSSSKSTVSSPSFARNSTLRGSKVEWNRSPKPFSPTYDNHVKVTESRSDGTLSSKSSQNVDNMTSDIPMETNWSEETATKSSSAFQSEQTKPTNYKANTPEPSSRPISAKLASFEQKITENTPVAVLARTSQITKTPKQNLFSASTPVASKSSVASKTAGFSASTPAAVRATPAANKKTPMPNRATGFSASTPVASRATPAASRVTGLSASTPIPSKSKDCDPTELPISQRMSKMQEKLVNVATPGTQRKESEPTAFSVGARMSAWENMTSANKVSNIKKVDPATASPICKPKGYTPKKTEHISVPKNPPPPPAVSTKAVTPSKSFKDSIADKASEVLAKPGGNSPQKSSPQKSLKTSPTKSFKTSPTKSFKSSPTKEAVSRSPTKLHSPSKVGNCTKVVQQRLAEVSKESNTNGSSLAAQSRAARQAELDAIQNRWKNGILKDASSSEASSSESVDIPNDKKVNGKREASRNRAREEFNNKLADIGLDMGHSKNPSPPTQATSTTPSSKNVTGSIYSLIKKRDETKQTEAKSNDSFNDNDDESEKIPRSAAIRAAAKQKTNEEEFKKPAPVVEEDDTESDAISCSDVGDEEFGSSEKLRMDVDDDDISLKGFVSEQVRRESILPPSGTLQRPTSESSLDSYDEYAKEQAGLSGQRAGYQADGDDDEDDDSSMDGDRMAVDDLLDEALGDSEEDSGVKMRNDKPADYDPDMDPDNVVLRRRPQTRKRSNTSDEDDEENPYSLQAYRKSANLHMKSMEPIVRASKYVGKNVREENIDMPTTSPRANRDDKRLIQERIKELQELVHQEQSVIMQTSNALNKCCLGNSYFAGSPEQVECNRVLLIACQKRQMYMTEIQRLKNTGVLHPEGSGPQGSLTISDIRLPLKKDYVEKLKSNQELTTHYFILLIRNNCQVICTQMLSTNDPFMRGSLDFPNLIKINGITGNFKLTMDIYSMSVSKEPTKDKKRKTPKKTPKKGYAMHLESPGGPSAVRTTNFCHVTSVPLTMKSLDKTSFHLDRLPYLSPLYGQIFMRLKCLMESNVEERGFLTMFDDVSGFGAWHRRWCVLAGNKLCIWKYPDDETRKDPMFLIDLKRCITEKVGLVSREFCARPNTFALETVRQPLRGERNTLITTTHETMTSVRHQMSADSKEERIVWCNKLNRALANLRTWNADAVKPLKGSSSSSRC